MKRAITILFGLALITFLAGCEEDVEAAKKYNKGSLAGQPELIGKLSNGTPVYRYELKSPDGQYPQYLIIVGDQTTANYTRQSGKTRVPDSTAVIVEDPQITPAIKKKIDELLSGAKSYEDAALAYKMAATNLMREYGNQPNN